MLISEFARRVGLSTRMLCHYEQRGLLAPVGRDSNGYRQYDEAQLDTARRVRELIESGLPTRLVSDLLDTVTDAGGIYPEHVVPPRWRRFRMNGSECVDVCNAWNSDETHFAPTWTSCRQEAHEYGRAEWRST